MSKNLLMITGLGSARDLAQGKKGAFYNTLEEFHKYWERIDIIAPRVTGPQTTELFGNVHIHISPWPLFLHPVFFIKKGMSLHQKHHFDLMTVQDFPPFYNGLGAFILSLCTEVPYILEIHHIPGYPKYSNIKEWLYRLFARVFVALDVLPARAVRVVNKHQAREFLIQSGVPASKITYIPSMYIDHDVFKQTAVLKEYDIIFVGRLAENKGIDLFIQTARKLGVKTLIVGDGPEKSKVQKETRNQSNIVFHGWAKDSQEIASLLNKSKILVMPSFNEGGPRVVAEAMACGVPVVATAVGIIPDIQDACIVVDWDVDDIIDKVQKLLNDADTYQSKVERGLETAQQFSREIMIRNYAETLAHLI